MPWASGQNCRVIHFQLQPWEIFLLNFWRGQNPDRCSLKAEGRMQIFFPPCPSLCPLPYQHWGTICGPQVHAKEPRSVPAVLGLQPKRKKTIAPVYILTAVVTWKKDAGIFRIWSKVHSSQWECLCQSVSSSMGRVLDLQLMSHT